MKNSTETLEVSSYGKNLILLNEITPQRISSDSQDCSKLVKNRLKCQNDSNSSKE